MKQEGIDVEMLCGEMIRNRIKIAKRIVKMRARALAANKEYNKIA